MNHDNRYGYAQMCCVCYHNSRIDNDCFLYKPVNCDDGEAQQHEPILQYWQEV